MIIFPTETIVPLVDIEFYFSLISFNPRAVWWTFSQISIANPETNSNKSRNILFFTVLLRQRCGTANTNNLEKITFSDTLLRFSACSLHFNAPSRQLTAHFVGYFCFCVAAICHFVAISSLFVVTFCPFVEIISLFVVIISPFAEIKTILKNPYCGFSTGIRRKNELEI